MQQTRRQRPRQRSRIAGACVSRRACRCRWKNRLKIILSPIYRKHEKGVIADIKQFACEDAAVDKLTKGAVDDLIDEAWAASLDDPAFSALFDEARSACEACEIPSAMLDVK